MASSNPSSLVLPFELVEDILYRIPVASLVRFKSTCKQWYALLNDKRFIYKRLALSREGFIRVHNTSIQFMNLENLALSSGQVPSDINAVIHCDGLLLCEFQQSRCKINGDRSKLAVWNPLFSRVNWIEPSNSYYTMSDIYGFGYDNVSRDNYKILRFKNEIGYVGVEIYEFKSKLWRSVDYTFAYYWYTRYKALSMNGNMYWIAQRMRVDFKTEHFIQSFDFSREIFKDICVPSEIVGIHGNHTLIVSGFGGDRLSLLHQHKHRKIQVWVTNKVTDRVVSWSKIFNVTPPYLSALDSSYPTHIIHKTNRIMLWCEEKDVRKNDTYVNNFYEMGEGRRKIKKQVETGQRRPCEGFFRVHFHVFVPSLVPVPE